jgi:hypothetical protein
VPEAEAVRWDVAHWLRVVSDSSQSRRNRPAATAIDDDDDELLLPPAVAEGKEEGKEGEEGSEVEVLRRTLRLFLWAQRPPTCAAHDLLQQRLQGAWLHGRGDTAVVVPPSGGGGGGAGGGGAGGGASEAWARAASARFGQRELYRHIVAQPAPAPPPQALPTATAAGATPAEPAAAAGGGGGALPTSP